MDEGDKPDSINVPGKSKRSPPAKSEPHSTKIKRSHNCGTDLEESLDSDLESSITSSSTVESNFERLENKQNGGITNNFTKQPPIVITLSGKYTAVYTQELVNKHCTEVIYKNNGKSLIIYVNNNNDHINIIELLKKGNIEFHSYQRKEDRKPKIILKGLPLLPTDSIHEELVDHKINPINIQLIRSKNNKNVNQATYLITLTTIGELKVIKNIKHICNTIITWDRYQKTDKPTQCYNCQSFGHGSQNCYKATKCYKCAGNYSSKDNATTNNETTLKCINCNGEHSANDPNCPTYLRYTQNINNNKNENLN